MDASVSALKEHHEQLEKTWGINRRRKWKSPPRRWTSSARRSSPMSSETAYLALLLDGPLQSWGFASRFQRRTTGLHPTKSGVVGLICAAMGLAKGSPDGPVTLANVANLNMTSVVIPRRGAALGRGRVAGAPSGGLPHRARHASGQWSDEQGRCCHPPPVPSGCPLRRHLGRRPPLAGASGRCTARPGLGRLAWPQELYPRLPGFRGTVRIPGRGLEGDPRSVRVEPRDTHGNLHHGHRGLEVR